MIIAITLLAITAFVFTVLDYRKSKELKVQGKIIDFWNEYTKPLVPILVASIALVCKIEAVEIEDVFQKTTEIVIMLDQVLMAISALYVLVKGLKRTAPVMIFILAFGFNAECQKVWVKTSDGKDYLVDQNNYNLLLGLVPKDNEIRIQGIKPWRIIEDFLKKNADKIQVMTDQKKSVCNLGVKAMNRLAREHMDLDEDFLPPMFPKKN